MFNIYDCGPERPPNRTQEVDSTLNKPNLAKRFRFSYRFYEGGIDL